MSDFESCPRGTLEEVRLSRKLSTAIETELQQYGNTMPVSVITAYNRLYEFYLKQMEQEQ